MEALLPYLPGLLAALSINALGIASVRVVGPSRLGWRGWFHRTKTLHPVSVGVLIGLAPGIPVTEPFHTLSGRVLYFAGAGVLSTWVYATARQFAKKHGYELPGASLPPNSLRPRGGG
jgi:hypothetical protein